MLRIMSAQTCTIDFVDDHGLSAISFLHNLTITLFCWCRSVGDEEAEAVILQVGHK
jgi:hypothetical protein